MSLMHPPSMNPSMYYIPPTGPHSHLVCGGCSILLMYPQGASNVRCSRCGQITAAPPAAGPDTAQIVCNGCRVLLSYPRGAQSVQCSLCQTVTQVPVYGHVMCGGCAIMLMYPLGAQSVKCSVCHFVTNVSQQQGWGTAGPASSRPTTKLNQTVVVENPPTLDDKGNEVANIAVGVKTDTT